MFQKYLYLPADLIIPFGQREWIPVFSEGQFNVLKTEGRLCVFVKVLSHRGATYIDVSDHLNDGSSFPIVFPAVYNTNSEWKVHMDTHLSFS